MREAQLELRQAEKMELRYGGKCQRHGVLIVICDDRLRTVCQVSENCDTALGYTAAQLLGRSVDVAFDELSLGALRAALERPRDETPDWSSLAVRSPRTSLRWDCAVHRPPLGPDQTDQVVVLELEPFVQSDAAGDVDRRWGQLLNARAARPEGGVVFERRIPLCPLAAVRTAIDRLNVLYTEEALCGELSASMSRLLDFERVLVYKFCNEGHGRVVGEHLAPGASDGLESFAGLNFPSTDIPPSARKLFYEGRVRLIPDANDCGVDILPAINPVTHKPLDMMFCNLRAASKCCNQYHRNVDSMCQLIFSIIVENKLWGLVTAHCRYPRFVPRASRATFVPLIQVFSKCLELVAVDRRRAAELRVKSLSLEMFSRMAAEPHDFATGLLALSQPRAESPPAEGRPISGPKPRCASGSETGPEGPPVGSVGDVVECCGSAVVQNGRVATWGAAPPVADILTLLDVMKSLPPLVVRGERREHLCCTAAEMQMGAEAQLREGKTRALWFADSVSKELAGRGGGGALHVDWTGGFIATAVERGHLFWFRRAKVQQVRWAGDIAEPYVLRDGVLEARASFEIWKQFVADRCEPWTEVDVSAVAAFTAAARSALLLVEGISARRSFEALVSETRRSGISFLSTQEDLVRVLGSLPVPLFAVCSAGVVCLWSGKMVDVTGVSAEEAMGRHYLASLQTTAEGAGGVLTEVLAKATRGYTTAGVEVTVASRTRSRSVELVVCVAPLQGDPARGAIFVCQDVTRERELLQTSRALEQTAVQASTAKSLFLATLSHEIRTPLNGCLGMLQLALDTPNLPSEGEDCIHKALQSGAILQSMISSVLDWTLIEAGRLVLKEAEFDVREMISSSVHMFAPKAALKGIAVKVRFSDDFPIGIVSDCDRLRQVLLNLASNALKYSDKGEVVVEARVAARLEGGSQGPRARLRVEVSDEGRGMRPEDVTKLFQIFSRVVGPGEPDPGGTGLGLAISKKLVELLDGEIGVSSELGKGSTFYFEFPATALDRPCVELPPALAARREPSAAEAEAAAAPPPSPPPAAPCGSPTLHAPPPAAVAAISRKRRGFSPPALASHPSAEPPAKPNVLLVDDNLFNLQVAAKMLQALGCVVTTANDGVEAVEKATQPDAVWDICFMDLMMPRKDGLQATREIRLWEGDSGAPRTPIVALTAHTTSECKENTVSAGFDDYLTKPLTKKDLADALARHCKVGYNKSRKSCGVRASLRWPGRWRRPPPSSPPCSALQGTDAAGQRRRRRGAQERGGAGEGAAAAGGARAAAAGGHAAEQPAGGGRRRPAQLALRLFPLLRRGAGAHREPGADLEPPAARLGPRAAVAGQNRRSRPPAAGRRRETTSTLPAPPLPPPSPSLSSEELYMFQR